ncbi:hypothetical protein [Helicobacter heilmannii]|uniref:Uncharacterized protein n=1 Tax=Helicobacter heilmannii TaxID=35817 RepID=A0A0K2YA26_HELHE|nr:hypothetical protein [Helicobacter heilmannii]CCM11919.1 hypothetical protein BN341_8700 [Helicobacter heilmannii ASB1.4]CRI35037.1 hypothetical protein HHE01_00350 [Helicobacter heilmannii]
MENLQPKQGEITLCLDLEKSANFKVMPFVALILDPSKRMFYVAESQKH